MRTRYWLLTLSMFFITLAGSGQGHYAGSSFNPNDYFTPPPGFITPVYYSFANMDYFNGQGKRSDVLINPVPGNPTTLSISQNVKTSSFIAMLLYGAKTRILGANWGFMVIPTVNNPTANIALDYFSSQTGSGSASFNTNSWGLGDVYVQPVWLTWTHTKWTYAVAYGAWLPMGKYKTGDAKNVGLGYWSHNLRGSARFKPHPQWAITGAAILETNSRQKGVDFREAPHATFDYGAAYIPWSRAMRSACSVSIRPRLARIKVLREVSSLTGYSASVDTAPIGSSPGNWAYWEGSPSILGAGTGLRVLPSRSA